LNPPEPAANAAPTRLTILDGHAQAFRSFYAQTPQDGPDGRAIHALVGMAGVLARLVRGEGLAEGQQGGVGAGLVAVVLDAPTEARQTFRSELYPAYKANRSPRPEGLAHQLALLPELVSAYGIRALHDPRFEADDLIATLVALAEDVGLQTTILSGDKDLLQLVSPNTTVVDTQRNRRYDPAAVRERFGVEPRQLADWLALVGDDSDNIPGVPGLGPKAATRILVAAGSLEAAICHPERLARPQAVKLLAARDLARLSRSLTTLRRDVPLPDPLGGAEAATPGAWLEALLPPPRPTPELPALLRRLGLPLWLLPRGPHG
jgi:DNA polymerase-1